METLYFICCIASYFQATHCIGIIHSGSTGPAELFLRTTYHQIWPPMTYVEVKCHITLLRLSCSNSCVKQFRGVSIILNISDVPQLELVCFTTIRLIRYVLYNLHPSTPFNRNYRPCRHFWRYVNGGDMMNI